ncbi:MAG TPA: alpha/beta fold hydrolase [Acidimicrobiales bacterium]|nr:alpha/beta fold hydrolase [Acidimicrobiales bacterium]
MHLHVVREGAGPVVVLTHGLGDSSDTWSPVAASLVERFTVVRWDLRGHGGSDAPDEPQAYSRELAVADLDGVLAGLRRPVLVGHSLGGYISLARAVQRADDIAGLVLLASGPGFRNPVSRQRWNEGIHENAERYGVPAPVLGLGLQPDDVVIGSVPSLDIPLLVLVGDRDDPSYHAGASFLASQVPGCRVEVLPGGHRFHVSAAARVAEVIGSFVAEACEPLTRM